MLNFLIGIVIGFSLMGMFTKYLINKGYNNGFNDGWDRGILEGW